MQRGKALQVGATILSSPACSKVLVLAVLLKACLLHFSGPCPPCARYRLPLIRCKWHLYPAMFAFPALLRRQPGTEAAISGDAIAV